MPLKKPHHSSDSWLVYWDYEEKIHKRYQSPPLPSSIKSVAMKKYKVAELVETVELKFEKLSSTPSDENSDCTSIVGSELFICGSLWRVEIELGQLKSELPSTPPSINKEPASIKVDDFFSVYLVHLGSKTVSCAYTIRIKNQITGQFEYTYEDPEGIIDWEKDDRWGSHELISMSELLDSGQGYYLDDTIALELTIGIYSSVDIGVHPLAKAIENAAETQDLIALADADLDLIRHSLPKRRDAEVSRRQDTLLMHLRDNKPHC